MLTKDLIRIVRAVALVIALGACSTAEVEESADVDVDRGRAPELDVDSAGVDITTDAQPSEAAAELFVSLQGRWDCSGAFANGTRLDADLEFSTSMDGRVLRFRHVDRPPAKYIQESTWAFDAASSAILSMAVTTTSDSRGATPALYVARQWTDRSLTLVAEPLLAPPWRPNRFTYDLDEADVLRKVWEVERGGVWHVGDRLECARAAATQP